MGLGINILVTLSIVQIIYTRVLTSLHISFESTLVQIFFSELKYTYIESEEAYTVLALMCDIGGALGLILGSTMLTFCEFSDFLFTSVVAWLKVRASTDVISK